MVVPKDDALLQSALQDSLISHRDLIARRQEYLRTLRAQLDPSFVLQEVCGDGACMFRAFSFSCAEVSGIHHDVKLVRHKCVENIRGRPQLAARFADQSAADSYLNQMSLPYTYGDELCLHSLALTFNVKVAVVTPDYGTLLFVSPIMVTITMTLFNKNTASRVSQLQLVAASSA